ncbi:MAG TPA: monovalent cation/H(+) antiporter subunit G [Telluria sp.]
MTALAWTSDALLVAGAAFLFAGTVGLVRFPDLYTRLHALAKADNLGLGLTVLGLMLRADSVAAALKLVLAWLLVITASAVVSFLLASHAHRRGIDCWQRPGPPP